MLTGCGDRLRVTRPDQVSGQLRDAPLALMSDHGTPLVTTARWMTSRFQGTLADLHVRHIRTQIDTPWTNGKIEVFWCE